ncbi:PAS domain S-box protein [Sesbania bispinosa]|nr:PAS domain S-box protein [Sesbania bispinosa]
MQKEIKSQQLDNAEARGKIKWKMKKENHLQSTLNPKVNMREIERGRQWLAQARR